MNQEYKKGYNDGLFEVKNEINSLIRSLRLRCNPDPLGSMQECLADAEIQAFDLVLEIIKERLKAP